MRKKALTFWVYLKDFLKGILKFAVHRAEVIISIIFLMIGAYFMFPSSPEPIRGDSLFNLTEWGEYSKIGNVNVIHSYDSNWSEMQIVIDTIDKVDDKIELVFDFPGAVQIETVWNKDATAFVLNKNRRGWLYITIPQNKQKTEEYRVSFKAQIMNRLSNEEQYTFVNMDGTNIPFKVKYTFVRPSFSTIQFDGTVPEQSSYAYIWDDIRPEEINEPTQIKISTPNLKNQAQAKLIFGTIFLSLGASYLVNIIYGKVREKRGKI